MITFLTSNLLWSEGLEIVLFLALMFLCGFFWWRPFLYVSSGVLLGCLYFFRNPERLCEPALHDSTVLICPADGIVVDVQNNLRGLFTIPAASAGMGNEEAQENSVINNDFYVKKVAIFLSLWDVHAQWIPMSGKITAVTYVPGSFLRASMPESSCSNECNEITIANAYGRCIGVRQIAGKIARRVHCWVKKGDRVTGGQKFGMIKFGSRVEVLLPQSIAIAVTVGQKVYGGHTVLGFYSHTDASLNS